ncbi:MAG: hypothetical protein APF84_12215 [Gracilibacter sp. BRH_c7a]|nr:MAG: hypothetical protein APF84_12215 [Gracilibacter sp. BRH_c7a]
MEAALIFEEPKQKVVIPRQILGLTAVLLASTAVTPMNMLAVQNVSDLATLNLNPISVKQMEQVLDPQPLNLKTMEHNDGADIFGINNVSNIQLIESQKVLIQTREKIVASALLWQGVAYNYGGTTRAGVDCSALVQLVFRENGIQLERGSYEQFRQGVGIPKSKLEPGDLVFFNTNGTLASHVGIYLGDSQFISATKNCVEVQPLDMPYWAKTYHASRRVIE